MCVSSKLSLLRVELILVAGELYHYRGKVYDEEYMSPYGGSAASTPRKMQSAPSSRNINFATAKTQMLGSEGRPMHMNTSAVVGYHPMSSVVYGFRPESGWTGVLFQVFLQGIWVANWQKQKELDFRISFQGQDVPAVLYEMESTVTLPEIGTKRYVLQCIAPERFDNERCSITMSVNGLGGKTIVGGLFIGNFQYRPDGMSSFSRIDCRWNVDDISLSQESEWIVEVVERESSSRN